ncbi:hypothetical protein BJ912DRAFT_176288 [Pholiota molesta]|nr:hypothetical protein BJ912DRAFT_176288 [Pholiota molesta]
MPPPPLISNVFIRVSFLLLLFFLVGVDHARALKNTTVDDQDPAIVYAPAASWARINDSSTVVFDSGGNHMLTSDPAANATFTFTGVAIYFLSARWPYAVNTAVTLDNGTAVLLDLVDHTRADTPGGGGPATVKAQVVARAVGLRNGTHTLTVSVGAGQTFALVDALIYTTLAAGDTAPNAAATPPTQLTPVPPASSTTPATSSSGAKSKSRSTKLAIGLSILGAILLILLLIALWWCCTRRDRASSAHARRSTYSEPDREGEPGRRGVALHDPPVGGAPRDMRRAYGDEGEGEEEKEDLRVANPDLAPASPASSTPTMRDGAGRAGVGAGIAMPGSHYASASANHDPNHNHDPAQQQQQGGQQQQQHSPGRFYGALREMAAHSPARAYPVRDARSRGAVPSAASAPSAPSVSVYTDSQGHRSRAYSGPGGGGYPGEEGGYGEIQEEEGGGGGGGLRVPPRAQGRAQGHGRDAGASGRSSAAVTSDLPGEDRWAYPKAPLAYVPVFKA